MKRLLMKALKNAFDMNKEDAIDLAKSVEKIFKGKDEIEDMSIDKYTRSLFYELQREKLLKIRREEIKEKGKSVPIRKFYWSFDEKVIREKAVKTKEKIIPYEVYQKIPRKAWVAHYNNT